MAHLPFALSQGPPGHLPWATRNRFLKQIPLQGMPLKQWVLKAGDFPPGDIWQHQDQFLVVTVQG